MLQLYLNLTAGCSDRYSHHRESSLNNSHQSKQSQQLTTVGGLGRPGLLGGQANTAKVVASLGSTHVVSGKVGLLAATRAVRACLTWLAGVGVGASPGHECAGRADCIQQFVAEASLISKQSCYYGMVVTSADMLMHVVLHESIAAMHMHHKTAD